VNRVNFVLGAYPDDIQMNRIQESAENTNKDTARTAIGRGVSTGFNLSVIDNMLNISPGVGYDDYGWNLKTTEPKQTDLSEITRPPAGQVKWVAITALYIRNNYGDTYDMDNNRHDLFLDDDVEIKLIQGPPGVSGSTIRPEIPSDLILADWQIDNTTPFADLPFDFTRKITVVSISNAFFTRRVILSGSGPFEFLFSNIEIPVGQYKIYTQMTGKNRWQMPVNVEEIAGGVRLYTNYFDGQTVKSGTAHVKVGEKVIGAFKIGVSSEIITDLLFKLEA